MLEFALVQLRKIGPRAKAAKKGTKTTAGIFTHLLQAFNANPSPSSEHIRLVNGTLPDMLLDARGLMSNEFSDVTGSTFFDFVETLFDVKGYGISESSGYLSFRAGSADIKPIDSRSLKVHKEYVHHARTLDADY